MLTKDELCIQKEKPNIKDISLELYKEFSEEILFNQIFVYYFTNGTTMRIEFREWVIYHMLAIQHINGKIGKDRFFSAIENGLTLSDFTINDSIKNRYKIYKERITMFSCMYSALKEANVFYLPSGKVQNTKNAKADYIVFSEIGSKGMNIGLMKSGEVFVPMTILISKPSNKMVYLEDAIPMEVERLEIINIPIKEKEQDSEQ